MRRFFLCLLLWLGAAACRSGRPAPEGGADAASPVRDSAPAVSAGERSGYLKEHFWDGFDFADTLRGAAGDAPGLLRAVRDYVALCSSPEDPAAMARLMERASGSKAMLLCFASLCERILYDPNSPLRSDELYAPVLEALVRSPLLDRWEKMAPEHDLRLIRRNRRGTAAADFRYMELSGRCGRLYDLRADFTLLFFNNPDCGMCARLREELLASPLIGRLVRAGRLAVLALYPDADLGAWRAHAGQMPREWVYGCDPAQAIAGEELYDLRAIPSLYLLDGEKRVLLKDVFSVSEVEHALREALGPQI
ncbi:MAG: DUF5106 domain-containing protein [Alistipes sp.]|nr:DUF5106 domain-containing protein [Alistipes sp.]